MHAEPYSHHEPQPLPTIRDKAPWFCAQTLSGWECCPIEQDGCDCPARRKLDGECTPVQWRPKTGRYGSDNQELVTDA